MSAAHAAGAVALYIAANGRATNAAGVYAIRQALVNTAQPQTAWGSANTMDPDVNHEGLVYVAGISPSGNNPPVVTITSPTTAASFAYNANILFSGSSTDLEEGSLTARLTWNSSINGQIGTGGSFNKTLSPGTHTITATVSDSGGKTASASVSVTVRPNNAPVVSITAPSNGTNFASGTMISFAGTAMDSEDGSRTASLVWTSSINGLIGTNGTCSKVLSAGTHSITAKATDSSGMTGVATRNITVLSQTNLSVSVVTDKLSYVSGNRVSITATVTDGVNRVAGVAAQMTLVTANGRQVISNATTGSTGIAHFQYRISSSRDGIGTYRVTVAASKAGYTNGSGVATFPVTQ